MRPSTVLMLLFVLGAIGAGVTYVVTRTDEMPDDAFEEVQLEIARGHSSPEAILEGLRDALVLAEASGEGATVREILKMRGKVHLDLGALDDARRDFERALDLGPDPEIASLLVEVELQDDELDQAAVRVAERLAEDPADAEAWIQAAGVYVRQADRRVEACLASLARVLVSEDEAKAEALMRRGAALDAADPLRVAVGHKLWQLLADDADRRRQEALDAMDAASAEIKAARQAYAHALELEPAPAAVAGLLELLARSENHDETLDLGIASLPFQAVRQEPDTALILIRTLRESGHLAFAKEFAAPWAMGDPKDIVPNSPLYEECCRTMLANESWPGLVQAANKLGATGDPRLVPHADLYRGIAVTRQGGYARARGFLTQWLDDERTDPFPGARTLAWQCVADCWAELDQPELQRLALEHAVEAGAELDGEAWLELAELQFNTRHGGYRTPEERWARGMAGMAAVDDERADELFQRWREMGQLEIETTAFDPAAEHRNMVRTETWNPRPGLSAYELFRLAEEHEVGGDPERALMTHRRLLDRVPGFPPSVDRSIDLALQLGYEKEAAALLLGRMERTGRDAYARGVLAELDLELLGRDDLLLLMRLDPELTGRRRLAVAYDRTDSTDQALAVLGDLTDPELDADLRWYGIELLSRLGRFDEAAALLDELALEELSRPQRLAVMVDAYAGAKRKDRVAAVVERMLGTRNPDKAAWLAAVDKLLDAGYADLASDLVARLAESPATSGGQVLVRAAITSLLDGDAEAALRFAMRAEAFPTGGAAELLHLVTLVELERYHELRSAVRYLRLAEYPTTAEQELALTLLEDDLPRAREIVVAEAERNERDPVGYLLASVLRALDGDPLETPAFFGEQAGSETEWLLHGSGDDPDATERDPRRLAALLFALEDPLGALWARGALAALDASGEHLWPTFLVYATRTDRRAHLEMRGAMQRLTEGFPRFGPAWDRLDRLLLAETGGDLGAVDRVELRIERRRVLGDDVLTPLELALDRARQAWHEGQPYQAAKQAKDAVAIAPDSFIARRLLVAFYARAARFDKAVPAVDAALDAAPEGDHPGFVLGALEIYKRAEAYDELEPQELAERLERLAARFPHDPAVALARAEFELVAESQNPALGVARAYAHLDRFQDEHPRTALEDLRPGSAVAWGRFLLPLDPERGERFVREQLLLKPGSLELWVFEGEILRSNGDAQEALRHMQIVHRMAPNEGRVLRKLAELEALNGYSRKDVNRRVQQIRAVLNLTDTDPQLAYWRAMAIMGEMGSRGVIGSIDRLRRVWRHRTELRDYLAEERVALRYASVLIARGSPDDRQLARDVIATVQDKMNNPYQQDLAVALVGLSHYDASGAGAAEPR